MRELDPGFDVEGFTGDLREYIIPELLDAYLGADKEALKQWCGEAVRSPPLRLSPPLPPLPLPPPL